MEPMPKQQRIIVSLLLAVGGGMLVLAALTASGSDNDVTITGVPEIDEIFPEREASILRQDRVGIDLRDGYVADLAFELSDGTRVSIPSDQLEPNLQNTGRFAFKPGDGQVIEAFPPRSNCVTATYWPVDDRQDVATIRWCFDVQA